MTTAPVATGLVARSRRIEPPADLLGALGPGGFAWLTDDLALVTAGVAALVAPPDVEDALGAIERDDDLRCPGSGPLAVGALPFLASGDELLTVPARVTVIAGGEAWVTEVAALDRERDAGVVPSAVRIEPVQRQAEWEGMVRAALDHIGTGALEKVVLAREVVVHADAPFDVAVTLDRLHRTQHGCIVFAADGFIGASPELLVRRRGATVSSRPVAGTTPRGATEDDDRAARAELAASVKNGAEHRLVVEAVVAALEASGVALDSIGRPEVAPLPSVSHLATTVTGHVDEGGPSALDLAQALHPTPAVGGTPRDVALQVIDELEPFDRGRYAGPVGWVGADGDGEWAVALRCAELDGSRARLLAGAGIVAGSEPASEWAETEAKFEPMLQVLTER